MCGLLLKGGNKFNLVGPLSHSGDFCFEFYKFIDQSYIAAN